MRENLLQKSTDILSKIALGAVDALMNSMLETFQSTRLDPDGLKKINKQTSSCKLMTESMLNVRLWRVSLKSLYFDYQKKSSVRGNAIWKMCCPKLQEFDIDGLKVGTLCSNLKRQGGKVSGRPWHEPIIFQKYRESYAGEKNNHESLDMFWSKRGENANFFLGFVQAFLQKSATTVKRTAFVSYTMQLLLPSWPLESCPL